MYFRRWWHHLSVVVSAHLEFFQLGLNINCQGWIHGLVLTDEVFESVREGNLVSSRNDHKNDHSSCIHTKVYLMEKSLKSPRRSQTRRPVRDALLEYAGPMPFLVVPMLLLWNTSKSYKRQIMYTSVLLHIFLWHNDGHSRLVGDTPACPSNTYVFPSWACLSLSCKPSTTWWKSNTTEESRQIY